VSVAEVIGARLRPRGHDLGPEWHVWEHKTLNIHRGVLHWQTADACADLTNLPELIRANVKASFRISWLRGFAFGVLIESDARPLDRSIIEDWIDIRARLGGTWQWTIYACPPARTVVAVHTWQEGFLSPIYRSLLERYHTMDYLVSSSRKENEPAWPILAPVTMLQGMMVREFRH
jgi:hypothetical protein